MRQIPEGDHAVCRSAEYAATARTQRRYTMLPRNPEPSLVRQVDLQRNLNALKQRQRAANDEYARRMQRYKEQDEAEERAHAAQREADRTARTKAAEGELKATMRARYLTLPGSTEAGFNREWPSILREYQMRELTNGQTPQEELVDYFRHRRHSVTQPF